MRKRADILLVEKGLVESRARAKAEIQSGNVLADDVPVSRPGQKIPTDIKLSLTDEANPWVSRAALKLDFALGEFRIDLTDCTVLDLGASTGGFSQVALAKGASRVFAVDVGHEQLHPLLGEDERVTSLEGVNARSLTASDFDCAINCIVSDLSFISLTLGLPPALELASPDSVLIALIKPQFEAGRKNVGRGGLVKDPEIQKDVVNKIEKFIAETSGWAVIGTCESPITGSDGNKEFLIAAKKEK